MNTVQTFPTESSNIAAGFQARVENSDMVDPEITRLRTRHPVYDIFAPEWSLYLAAYEGGPDFANMKNLFRHQRENPDDYNDRGKRVHYFNYCAPLTDFFTNFIFTETIQRDGASNEDFFLQFIDDVNKKGENITQYMMTVSEDMQIFGMVFTLVDSPKTPTLPPDQVLTEQDIEDLGIRPYWVSIKPDEILDWETDDFDRLLYLKRMQPTFDRTLPGVVRRVEKYTEWYENRTVVTFVDVTSYEEPSILHTETFDNTLGEIPIVVTRYKRSKKYPFIGNSFLRDFAYNNREVMNYTSLLQEFLYRQCFNILAKESDTTVPFRDQEDNIAGTSNVIEFPKGANAPTYISPPIAPAQFIQSERERIVSEMFKRASQDTLNELFNGEKSSGFSQAQSFSKTVPFIATRADTLERTEVALMKLTCKIIGKTWDGKIKYKDRYELTNVTDALAQLMMIFKDLQMPSETFVKEEFKRLIHELDGKIVPEVMVKILSEIDGMDYGAWSETMKDALIGIPPAPGGGGSSTTENPSAGPKKKKTPDKPTTTAESAKEAKAGAKKPASK